VNLVNLHQVKVLQMIPLQEIGRSIKIKLSSKKKNLLSEKTKLHLNMRRRNHNLRVIRSSQKLVLLKRK